MDFTGNYSWVLRTVLQIEGIEVNRDSFLREVLGKYCEDQKVELAIHTTPHEAGILKIIIDLIVERVIKEETENTKLEPIE